MGKFKGKDLFDVSLFNDPESTAAFYRFMAALRTSSCEAQPTTTHRFLKTLKDRGTLLRSYTQNIDGLEARVGLNLAPLPLRNNDVLQLHGDIHKLKCFLCSEVFHYKPSYTDTLLAGEAPDCPACADKCAIRVAAGRRSLAIGTLRPDIVLYGEQHPAGDAIGSACSSDLKRKPDCLIIAGTSLKVPGLKALIKNFAKSVRDQKGLVIFVNLSDVGTSEWSKIVDYHVQCRSDDFVEHLKTARPSFFTRQTTLDGVAKTKKIVERSQMSPRKKAKFLQNTSSDRLNLVCEAPLQLANVKVERMDEEKTGFEVGIVKMSLGHNKENINPLKRSLLVANLEDREMRPCRWTDVQH